MSDFTLDRGFEKKPTPKAPKRKRVTFLKYIFILFLWGTSFSLLFLTYVSWRLPSLDSLKSYRPSVGTEVFSRDFVKIGEFYRKRRVYRAIETIPKPVIHAFVAAEDSAFFTHNGISFQGIFRAAIKNLAAGRFKQGGSTITQQVARSLLLSSEKKLMRKIKEALLAFKIENFIDKQQILEIYLNEIYLGDGAYGIEAAAETYFGKTAEKLHLAEIAMIAGLPRAPSRDNPRKNFSNAKKKQAYVLNRMREDAYITSKLEKEATDFEIKLLRQKNLNLTYAPYFVEHVRRSLTEKYGDKMVLEDGLQVFTTVNAKSALAARKALTTGIESVDRHQGYRGALKNISKTEWENQIQTLKEENLEPNQLETTYEALVLSTDDKKKETHIHLGFDKGIIHLSTMTWARKPNPDRFWEYHKIKKPSQALSKGDLIKVRWEKKNIYRLFQDPKVQGAILAIDPHSGSIEAMEGGYNFEKSEFNRAIQAKRQPGSSFKPFIFSAALEQGYTSASVLVDAPIVYDDPAIMDAWKPKNYSGKFHGNTIFRDSLIKSRNIPTIKIVQDIGISSVISHARKLGITSPLSANLSISLGASAISLMELVKAYSVFAAQGRKLDRVNGVIKILDRSGSILERNFSDDFSANLLEQTVTSEKDLARKQEYAQAVAAGISDSTLPENYVISPQKAYIMTHLLKQVITAGTGARAKDINRPAAGKTGTTNDNHDAWFVGYTPNLVTAVWIGFDDVAKSLGTKEDGGRIASPIWLDFMKEALKNIPEKSFEKPDGLVTVKIDAQTGSLATPESEKVITELFIEGTEPTLTNQEVKNQKTDAQDFFMDE